MYKKKGTSLLEILIYIGLFSIIMNISIIGFINIRKNIIQTNINSEIDDIKKFIFLEIMNNRGLYNTSYIKLDEKNNSINGSNSNFKLTNLKINFRDHTQSQFKIHNGYIVTGLKIVLRDQENNKYEIRGCESCDKMHY